MCDDYSYSPDDRGQWQRELIAICSIEREVLFYFLKFYLCVPLFLFLVALGLCGCGWAFSSCGEWALPSSCGAWASLLGGFSCCGVWLLSVGDRSCAARTELLRGKWNLPRPETKPVFPALAGRFLTTGPPGKSKREIFKERISQLYMGNLGEVRGQMFLYVFRSG